jgi:hypothetical protein
MSAVGTGVKDGKGQVPKMRVSCVPAVPGVPRMGAAF